MLHFLSLILPGLIPSRPPPEWHEFRPRPPRLSIAATLRRLLWNPDWNEALYLVSLAERLMSDPTDHSIREISQRIISDLKKARAPTPPGRHLQFRLVFVCREGVDIAQKVTYLSAPCSIDEISQ